MNNYSLLSNVIEIAEEAGRVLLQIQGETTKIIQSRKDFLTKADLESNSLIVARLKTITPSTPVYSEEDEKALEITGEKTWVVDPLDGTVNFFHQDFLWGVSIALVEEWKTKLGVVFLPVLGQLVGIDETNEIVVKGNRSFGVRKESQLSEAQIWTDWGKGSTEVLSLLPKLAKFSLYPQLRLCGTASLMAVASGKICAYIHPHPAPEDFAAAALIVEKFGGKVTDLQNNPWNVLSKSIIASNGILHEQILKGLGLI